MCCLGKWCGPRKFNISSGVSCINLLSTHNSESRSYHKMHVMHADLGMHLCSLNIIWCNMQSTCIQINVNLLRKGYNIRLILLGQIDMLGGNIYPPVHILVRNACILQLLCLCRGGKFRRGLAISSARKGKPYLYCKKFNMRAFRENRYQLYTESFKRIPQKLYASAVC